MKQILSILLVSSVISITLFGFVFLHTGHSSHATRCLASLFTGPQAPCPQADPMGFIGYHVGAFQSFSLATLISVVLGVLMLAVQFILPATGQALSPVRRISRVVAALPAQFHTSEEWRWYSLHENSPSFS